MNTSVATLGNIFQNALDAEMAGDLALSAAWRRLLFAMARDLIGLIVVAKPVFAEAEPIRKTIYFADDLLDGIRAAVAEPKNPDAQRLPSEFKLEREHLDGLGGDAVWLVSPEGKRLVVVGIDTDPVTNIDEIKLALRKAKKYNRTSKTKNTKQPATQLAFTGA